MSVGPQGPGGPPPDAGPDLSAEIQSLSAVISQLPDSIERAVRRAFSGGPGGGGGGQGGGGRGGQLAGGWGPYAQRGPSGFLGDAAGGFGGMMAAQIGPSFARMISDMLGTGIDAASALSGRRRPPGSRSGKGPGPDDEPIDTVWSATPMGGPGITRMGPNLSRPPAPPDPPLVQPITPPPGVNTQAAAVAMPPPGGRSGLTGTLPPTEASDRNARLGGLDPGILRRVMQAIIGGEARPESAEVHATRYGPGGDPLPLGRSPLGPSGPREPGPGPDLGGAWTARFGRMGGGPGGGPGFDPASWKGTPGYDPKKFGGKSIFPDAPGVDGSMNKVGWTTAGSYLARGMSSLVGGGGVAGSAGAALGAIGSVLGPAQVGLGAMFRIIQSMEAVSEMNHANNVARVLPFSGSFQRAYIQTSMDEFRRSFEYAKGTEETAVQAEYARNAREEALNPLRVRAQNFANRYGSFGDGFMEVVYKGLEGEAKALGGAWATLNRLNDHLTGDGTEGSGGDSTAWGKGFARAIIGSTIPWVNLIPQVRAQLDPDSREAREAEVNAVNNRSEDSARALINFAHGRPVPANQANGIDTIRDRINGGRRRR